MTIVLTVLPNSAWVTDVKLTFRGILGNKVIRLDSLTTWNIT